MVNEDSYRIGDIVVMGGGFFKKMHQTCHSTSLGVIVAFTCNGNPRVINLPYKYISKVIHPKSLLMRSVIMVEPHVVDKEKIFARGGNLKRNWSTLIISAQNYGKNKIQKVQSGKEKVLDLSISF